MRRQTGVLLLVLLLGTSCVPSPPPTPTYAPTVTPAGEVDLIFEFSEVRSPGGDPRELAVAFHSLQFLNYEDNITDELLFGTTEANDLQSEGWFENETWPDVGPFQWAGTPSRRASLRLQIPENTEGLLLRISGIKDGIWMDVKLDGEQVAKLLVDGYWHTGYVPVGPPAPGMPAAGELVWSTGRYYPRFPSADRLYAIPVRNPLQDQNVSWREGWRINSSHDAMMALTLVGMQGVINRGGASVYLDWQDQWNRSHFWISPHLESHVEVMYLDFDGLSAYSFLMRRFGDRFGGGVVYDPEIPDTINLATTYAGLEDRIILAQEQLSLPGMQEFASIRDLRHLAEAEAWDIGEESKHRIYQWVYEELWPDLEHGIIGVISPGPPTSGAIPGSPDYLPLGLAARDYIVALRLPALWLSPPAVEDFPPPCPQYEVVIEAGSEAELLATFLEDADRPIPVYGFFGANEAGTVALASLYGGHVPVLTNSNTPLSASNLTVFSSIAVAPEPVTDTIDYDRLHATLDASHVFTMWTSDGDNIQFLIDRGFHGGANFVWEQVQGHRFGWTINPTLSELAPLVWDHYVSPRDQVSLVAGLSGAGYMYPQLMDEEELRAYLQMAALYLNRTGLRTLHVSTRYGSWESAAEQYYTELSDAGFLGAFVRVAGFPYGLNFHYAGVPTPGVVPSYVLYSTNWQDVVENLLARRSDEVLVEPGSGYPTWHSGEIVDDPVETDADNVALLFSQESVGFDCGLGIWGPFASLAPGHYNVAFRLKVPDNLSPSRTAGIWVGRKEGCRWIDFARRDVYASDFAQPGEYQDFTLRFGLDQVTTDIEFGLDYDCASASTDLYLDTIRGMRDNGLDLPVFAAALIPLTAEAPADTLQLVEELEAAGVLVLDPDEFMAALNPEFMIDWATPILGSESTALGEARAQLEAGDFLESLLTVRQALRTLPERAYMFDVEVEGQDFTVEVTANAWVTDFTFDQSGRQLSFRTHGPPEGTVQAVIIIPNGLLAGPFVVNIDGQPHDLSDSQDESHTTLNLEFVQGPHQVVIVGE